MNSDKLCPEEFQEFERLLTVSSHAAAVSSHAAAVSSHAAAVSDAGNDHGNDHLAADVVRRVTGRANELAHKRYAVGIELLPYRLVGALIDEHGERLADEQLVLDRMDVATVVSGAASLTAELLAAVPYLAAASGRIALGFQLGAPVDTGTGTVLFYRKSPPEPPSLVREIRWPDRQPLGQILEQATGLPSVVENDANAYAVFQLWFGAGREVSRFAIVLIREGVGGSLVIGGRLFDGPVELGNLSVLPESKRPCDCGSVGCLETTGGVYGILENTYNYTGESLDDVVVAAGLADHPDTREAARQVFGLAGYANAKGIGVIVNLARPQRVVLYAPPVMACPDGAAATAFRGEVEKSRAYCHAVYGDCELVIEPLRPYDGAHGAVLIALDRRFGILPEVALVDAERQR